MNGKVSNTSHAEILFKCYKRHLSIIYLPKFQQTNSQVDKITVLENKNDKSTVSMV